MKEKFYWAYKLTNEDILNFVENSVFFFDTNILDQLWQLNKETANEMLDLWEILKDKILITNHVAYEYHCHLVKNLANRLNAAISQYNSFKNYQELRKKIISDKFINYLSAAEKTQIDNLIRKSFWELQKFLSKKIVDFKNEFNDQELTLRISAFFSNSLINALTDEELINCKEELIHRAAKLIPPGYIDYKEKIKKRPKQASNENEESDPAAIDINEAGDYIIWCEMKKWAKQNQKNIIFITNDKKEDWIWKEHNYYIGPRQELRKEFYEETNGQNFYLLNYYNFLYQCPEEGKEKVQNILKELGKNNNEINDNIDVDSTLEEQENEKENINPLYFRSLFNPYIDSITMDTRIEDKINLMDLDNLKYNTSKKTDSLKSTPIFGLSSDHK